MRTTRKDTPRLSVTQVPPATRLKRLRERAGVTALACAQALNKVRGKDPKTASPNTWYRWESVDRVAHTAMPDEVISACIPLLVGKGTPPVTADELIALSSAHKMITVRAMTTGVTNGKPLPQPVVTPVVPDDEMGAPLEVRYKAERGVFMETDALLKRTLGPAPILASREIMGEQFCVLVADGPTAGTVLQCVAPSAYTNPQLKGRRVVMVAERTGTGLSEVGIGQVESATNSDVRVVNVSGEVMPGEIYGVVIGSYARD